MRSFVVIGQRALASPDFLLDDLAGTSGRLDVLVRCLRAALLVSHGARTDSRAYLVLLGGPRAPRTLRFDGATAKFIRPEERSLATLVKKSLASQGGEGFVEVRPGVALAEGGLDAVLADVRGAAPYVALEDEPDIREMAIAEGDVAFFFGDHLGFDEVTRAKLSAIGATPVGLGPVSVHAEDAVAIVANELDRRADRSKRSPRA
jgi:tRNA (pseudouridine54-N1)-methyltransferase